MPEGKCSFYPHIQMWSLGVTEWVPVLPAGLHSEWVFMALRGLAPHASAPLWVDGDGWPQEVTLTGSHILPAPGLVLQDIFPFPFPWSSLARKMDGRLGEDKK